MKNNEQHKQETLYLYAWLNEQYNKYVSIRKKPLKKRFGIVTVRSMVLFFWSTYDSIRNRTKRL